jgi:hypothetical protein
MERASSGNCAPPPCLAAQPRRGGPVAAVGGKLHGIAQAPCNKTPHDAETFAQDCTRLHNKLATQDTLEPHTAQMSKSTATGNDGRVRSSESLQYAIQHATNKQPAAWVVSANESPTSRMCSSCCCQHSSCPIVSCRCCCCYYSGTRSCFAA